MHNLELETAWTVYDNKTKKFLGLTAQEFSSLLQSTKVNLTGEFKKVHKQGIV